MIGATKSVRLAVIDAFVDVMRRVSSIRGAEHDVPFDVERKKHPFAYVYDTDEEYNLGSIHGQSDNTLSMEVAVVFEYAERPGQTPRVIGSRILAEMIAAVAADIKLGGVARDTVPTASTIRELATDSTEKLAALSVEFNVSYHYPQKEPFQRAA